MTEKQFDDSEIRRSIMQARQRLSRRTDAERETIIQDAIREALAAELEEERAESARTTQAIKQALTDPQAEAQRARKEARDKSLILLLLLVVLLLFAAATDRPNIIRLPGVNDTPPLSPRIDSAPQGGTGLDDPSLSNLENGSGAAIAAPGSLPGETYTVGAAFREHYDRNGGQPVFGLPISNPIEVNGRTVQWFERGRLEQWPEYAGTPYAIQGGRVGSEFTTGMEFPNQIFFVSRPGLRFFRETGHAVRDRFLSFWEQNGGLMVLGYPISDEVQERLPDGQIRTVQYFERARLELHTDQAGQVQIGLLGRGLYLNESRPQIIAPVRPTPVPMP
ncbi:MAG TPA: hypothetical protein VFS21_08340 [Roseiflexaceae bacterium]|nr:hypothetical protein [Roseiflexaceae bacterium]